MDKEMSLREYNIRIVKKYLDKYSNNYKLVADKLDIGRQSGSPGLCGKDLAGNLRPTINGVGLAHIIEPHPVLPQQPGRVASLQPGRIRRT